ncbi:MAG: 7-cyano-7-deazaguanine synthase, partial [Bdellovibrionales bacterium]
GEDHLINLSSLGTISDTALTREAEIVFEKDGLPNTFVPGRNLLFFTYAAAVAYRRNIFHLVGGMCETDFSGYPDCREDTIKALQGAINLGMARDFTIHTPLMHIDKAATWQLAEDLGGAALTDIIINETHTCYLGERGARHAWGYGCTTCPACTLRANGYRKWAENHTV